MKTRMNRTFSAVLVILLGLATQVRAINPILVTNMTFAGGIGSLAVSGNYLYTAGVALSIFDISNPTNPVQVGSTNLLYGGTGLAVSGNLAFVLDGGYTFEVFDISTPQQPLRIGQVTGNWQTMTVSGHYAHLNRSIYDISNPANPVQVGELNTLGPGQFMTHFVAVSNNYVYAAVAGTGLVVFDATDPTNPTKVGQASIPNVSPFDIVKAGNYIFLGSDTNVGFTVFSISNPTNPVVVSQPLVCCDLTVSVAGNFAYSVAGPVVLLDVSDPTNAVGVSFIYSGIGLATTVAGFGNYFYAAETADFVGLSIYSLGLPPPTSRIDQSSANVLLLSWPTPTGAFAVQQNPDLNPAHWTTLTNASIVVGSQNQVTLPRPQGTMFYRLVSQ